MQRVDDVTDLQRAAGDTLLPSCQEGLQTIREIPWQKPENTPSEAVPR